MSGFVGILNFDGAPVDRSLLGGMTAYMSYCGPDRQEVWAEGRVGLGHARLGTTFESAGELQPCSLDGRVWVAADARIDGRAELIRRLRSKGRQAKLDTPDGELILHCYEAWGEDCVQHLIGDFAFALWDARRRRLFCARDQFGVIPFYYAEVDDGLVLSNVLNCLRLHPAISDQLNERAIGDYLLFNMNMATDTTVFAGIRSLPPAHTLTWSDGALRVRRYWDLPEGQAYARFKKPEEYAERFGAVLARAVGDRLRTDRAGVHLSGGMDSTSIAATAHKLLRERGRDFDLRAYTIVYDWLIKEEEGRYADQVAAHLNIPVEHLAAEEFINRAPAAPPGRVSPEPAMIPNQTAEYEISRRVSDFSRLLLVGFGGDPLFSYEFSPFAPGPSPRGWGSVARELWVTLVVGRRLPRWGLRSTLRRRLGRAPAPPALPDWFNPDFARRVDLSGRWRQVVAEQESLGGLRRMLSPYWVTLFTWAHPGFHGLPLKVLFPFFDLRLVSCVSTTPPYPWRQNKFLLREAMAGLLPEAVRQRPKTPLYVFNAQDATNDPWHRLALQPERQRWARELIASKDMGRYIDVERAVALVESPAPASTRPTLSSCLPLAYWLLYRRRPEVNLNPRRKVNHVSNT